MRDMESQEAFGAPGAEAAAENAAPAEVVDEKRRKAMALLAKWTPPAMMTLMLSSRADAFSPRRRERGVTLRAARGFAGLRQS